MRTLLTVILVSAATLSATAAERVPGTIRSSIGVTRSGTPIGCVIAKEDLNLATTKTRILVVGGFAGRDATTELALKAVRWFYSSASGNARSHFVLSAVPLVNPNGLDPKTGRDPRRGYPPRGRAYNDRSNPEAGYLWRWIGMHAPDYVIELRTGAKQSGWGIPDSSLVSGFRSLPRAQVGVPTNSLANQLVRNQPADTGAVPALQYWIKPQEEAGFLQAFLQQISSQRALRRVSPARRELQRRLKRSPIDVARQLSKHYGHSLRSVVYIPALALIGRIRLGELTNDPSHLRDVKKIVAPYVEGKPTNPRSGSALSGHLVFCELARVSRGAERARYLALARNAADLGIDKSGKPKDHMPFHVEMSDAVFMGGPILARVGALTGRSHYFQACLSHLRFMRKLDLRKDGIYRHSPLDQSAWGRGNGFPAIGVAMCLTHLPQQHPGRRELIQQFDRHLNALAKHQDPTGCYHQVIDREESYRELTSTCMITFAMIRGMRLGVLDEKRYRPVVQRAWYALRTRIRPDGRLVDVCTGTGKQKSLRAYYDRTAILGRDARGGAMALLVSTELARWNAER